MKSAPFTGTYQATSILQGHAGVNGSNGVPHGREISSDMARLREIVCRATDCSTGSDELLALSADPYTRFHLSPERANVLRPLRSLLQGEVLQLGAEAGAWTRFLGECGGQVCAVEAD